AQEMRIVDLRLQRDRVAAESVHGRRRLHTGHVYRRGDEPEPAGFEAGSAEERESPQASQIGIPVYSDEDNAFIPAGVSGLGPRIGRSDHASGPRLSFVPETGAEREWAVPA